MQKAFIFLLSAFMLLQNVSFAEDTPAKQTETHTKTPDFSPPKDLKGPVFPLEEFIKEPDPDTNRFLSEFVSMMATLGLLIGLILIVAWFLKRMVNTRQEQANTTSIIKVIERRSLSPKSAVYLLEVEGKSLLIAESPNGITRLADYDTPEDEEAKLPSAFGKLLENKE